MQVPLYLPTVFTLNLGSRFSLANATVTYTSCDAEVSFTEFLNSLEEARSSVEESGTQFNVTMYGNNTMHFEILVMDVPAYARHVDSSLHQTSVARVVLQNTSVSCLEFEKRAIVDIKSENGNDGSENNGSYSVVMGLHYNALIAMLILIVMVILVT